MCLMILCFAFCVNFIYAVPCRMPSTTTPPSSSLSVSACFTFFYRVYHYQYNHPKTTYHTHTKTLTHKTPVHTYAYTKKTHTKNTHSTHPPNKQKPTPTTTIPPQTSLGSWSASTSPARSPSPTRYGHHPGGGNGGGSSSGGAAATVVQHRRRNHLQNPTYGTTSLCQRSRSPSPARLQEMRERDRLAAAEEMGTKLQNNAHFRQQPTHTDCDTTKQRISAYQTNDSKTHPHVFSTVFISFCESDLRSSVFEFSFSCVCV